MISYDEALRYATDTRFVDTDSFYGDLIEIYERGKEPQSMFSFGEKSKVSYPHLTYSPEKTLDELYDQFAKKFAPRYPRFLYRYRRANEFTLKEISTKTAFAWSILQQNDPLEYNHVSDPSWYFRYYRPHALLLDDLLESWDREPYYTSMLSTEERQKKSNFEQVRDSLYLICFSESPSIAPMWAHYCGGHTGVCIEYETRFSPKSRASGFIPVQYTNNYVNIWNYIVLQELSGVLDFNRREKVLIPPPRIIPALIKRASWSYEREWRIALIGESGLNGFVVSGLKAKRVITGLKCDDEFRKAAEKASERARVPVIKAADILEDNSAWLHGALPKNLRVTRTNL